MLRHRDRNAFPRSGAGGTKQSLAVGPCDPQWK